MLPWKLPLSIVALVVVSTIGVAVASSGAGDDPDQASTSMPADVQIDEVRVSADGRNVTVTFIGSPLECGGEPSLDVVEAGNTITLGVTVSEAPDGPCLAVGAFEELRAELDADVGSRQIVDAWTDKAVVVTPAGRGN